MRAAGLFGSELSIIELPRPEPGSGQVLVEVRRAGVCGSDLHADTYGLRDGWVLGHELSGTITEVGAGVDDARVGQRVAVLPVIGCAACGACRSGDPSHCRTYKGLGITAPGGFADFVVAGDLETFQLPDHLGYDGGALVEPLAIALHVVQRARLTGMEPVLVQGAGPIGLAVTAWLKARGQRRIVVSDLAPGRRELAVGCGADAVIDPVVEDTVRAFRAATGHKPEVIVDCAGGRLGEDVGMAGRDGRIVVAGYCAHDVPVNTQVALVKELELIFASWYSSAEFTHTLDAVATGRVASEVMVTDHVSLDELPAKYAALKHPNDHGKVLVTFG